MSNTTILELINKLEPFEDTIPVEFIVVRKTGQLVCMDVSETSKAMKAVMQLFPQGKSK